MKYSILALGNEEKCNTLSKKLDAQLTTYGNSLEVEYFDVVKEGLTSLVARSKSVHAILMCVSDIALTPVQRKIVDVICKNGHLHSACTRYIGNENAFDFCIVHDSIGGMFAGENGFRNNPEYGREAYCVHSYSELEIEKVARTAYELAEKNNEKIILADLDPHLATSGLWYKILTDINEDYPSISTACSQIRFVIDNVAKTPENLGIVLSDSLVGKALTAVANSTANADAFACYVGDTPLALYVYTGTLSQNALDKLAKTILSASLGGEM